MQLSYREPAPHVVPVLLMRDTRKNLLFRV